MKRKFFDTRLAVYAGLEAQLPRVLKYAVMNQSHIFSSGELTQIIQPIRAILKTPMAMLLDRLIATRQLANFAALYVSGKDTSVPELLTAESITLDLKQIPDRQQLASLPMLHDKILINLTGTIQQTPTGGYTATAIDRLQQNIVRGQLVASYWDNDDWPSPYIAEFAIKSYSMILAGMISRYYSLSMPEQLQVAMFLAFYMAQWMTGDNYDSHYPPAFLKCNYLGTRYELEAIIKLCNDKNPEGLTLKDVAELIAENGPEKMRHFDLSALLAIGGNLGGEPLISQFALEYPPYWVYILILSLSGAKTALVYQLNAQRLINEGRSKWLNAVLNDQRIININRGSV